MARSRSRPSRRPFAFGRLFFWILLIVETLWLGGFVWSTGSWIPARLLLPGGEGRPADQVPGWTDEKEAQLEELRIQELLAREAARGGSPTSPASPAPTARR